MRLKLRDELQPVDMNHVNFSIEFLTQSNQLYPLFITKVKMAYTYAQLELKKSVQKDYVKIDFREKKEVKQAMSVLKLYQDFDLVAGIDNVVRFFYDFLDETDEMLDTYIEVGPITEPEMKSIQDFEIKLFYQRLHRKWDEIVTNLI